VEIFTNKKKTEITLTGPHKSNS